MPHGVLWRVCVQLWLLKQAIDKRAQEEWERSQDSLPTIKESHGLNSCIGAY